MTLEAIENFIFQFEKENGEILKNHPKWTFLRNRVYMLLLKKTTLTHRNNLTSRLKSFSFFITRIFYGFKNWFKNYDTLVFTHQHYRKKLDDLYFDRVIDPHISGAKRNNTLFITLTNDFFIKTKKIHSEYIVSQTILDILGFALVPFFKKDKTKYIQLEDLLKNYKVKVNLSSEFRRFNAYVWLYSCLFKIYKPTEIIVATYYSTTRLYMVRAAKKLNIRVIECQHGFIGNAHPSYNSTLSLDRSFLPDEFWVFSKFDKDILKERGIYNQSQVHIKGDFFLDTLKQRNEKSNSFFQQKIKNYKYVVGVSLQIPLEKEMLPFYTNCAKLSKNAAFIILPRQWSDKYEEMKFPENLYLEKENNFYNSILSCTHHSTVFSSTAFEAQYLDIPNILVDIDGFASKYYSDLVDASQIVNNVSQFVRVLNGYN